MKWVSTFCICALLGATLIPAWDLAAAELFVFLIERLSIIGFLLHSLLIFKHIMKEIACGVCRSICYALSGCKSVCLMVGSCSLRTVWRPSNLSGLFRACCRIAEESSTLTAEVNNALNVTHDEGDCSRRGRRPESRGYGPIPLRESGLFAHRACRAGQQRICARKQSRWRKLWIGTLPRARRRAWLRKLRPPGCTMQYDDGRAA